MIIWKIVYFQNYLNGAIDILMKRNGIKTIKVGIGPLGFHLMIAAANKGDFEEAANQLKDSVWYSQVGDRGVELVEQLRTGQRRP